MDYELLVIRDISLTTQETGKYGWQHCIYLHTSVTVFHAFSSSSWSPREHRDCTRL